MTATLWLPTLADAAALRLCDLRSYGRSPSCRHWQQLLAAPPVVALAAGPRRSPTAIALAESEDVGWFRLRRLAVLPQSRRQGLGRLLVAELGQCHGLRLRLREDNLQALRFAVAAGFRVVAVDRGGFGDLDAVELERHS